MADGRPLPIRMCVVVPLEDGRYQPYCIACKWEPRPLRTEQAAENQARAHQCPRPNYNR